MINVHEKHIDERERATDEGRSVPRQMKPRVIILSSWHIGVMLFE